MTRFSYFLLYLFLYSAVIIDIILKQYALAYPPYPTIHIFSCLYFTYTLNQGISWGMLNAISPALLTTLIICMTLILSVIAVSHKSSTVTIGLTTVVYGSISNIIDRVLYGGVIDYLELVIPHIEFPIFNIADILIVGGWLYTTTYFLTKEKHNDNY